MLGNILFAFLMIVPVAFCAFVIYSRSKFKNKKNAGAFFFENDSMVLNTGVPYPILLNDIECVELRYNQWELQHKLSYTVTIKVIRKSGKSKWVFYKGYRTANLALPSDMKTALEEKGVRCVMIDK